MRSALVRFDRDQARHVGQLLLARLPGAAEAPKVLDLLIALEVDERTKSALVARRERDFGRGSAWWVRHRSRLARKVAPDQLEARLGYLTASPRSLAWVKSAPTTVADQAVELKRRVALLFASCATEIAGVGRTIRVRIDTTGRTPAASVRGAGKNAAACLRRSVASRFRSVGPARIRVLIGRP